jgi:hypothetical protein
VRLATGRWSWRQGSGQDGLENRRVALVIDHAAIATDQVAAIE